MYVSIPGVYAPIPGMHHHDARELHKKAQCTEQITNTESIICIRMEQSCQCRLTHQHEYNNRKPTDSRPGKTSESRK